MPQIIITSDLPDGSAREIHRERISTADVETEAAGSLLIERIGWALSDADELEWHDDATAGPVDAERAA